MAAVEDRSAAPMKRIVTLLVVLAVLGAGFLYLTYGTIEPCGILREKMRREAVREGGDLGGLLATAMPDTVLNAMISAQHDNEPVTPALCIRILVFEPTPRPGASR
ncbi:MAG TPA: hypothetical protein VJR47_18230 [Stellaceae bacterium]|nr:hypothetical protein [Stellaceae bacterium]